MSSSSRLDMKTLLPPFRPNQDGSFDEVDEKSLRPWQKVYIARIFLEQNPLCLNLHPNNKDFPKENAEAFFSQWKLSKQTFHKWIKHAKELEVAHGLHVKEGSTLTLTPVPSLSPPFAPNEFGIYNSLQCKKLPEGVEVTHSEKAYFRQYLAKYGKLLDLSTKDAAARHGLANTTISQWPEVPRVGGMDKKRGRCASDSSESESCSRVQREGHHAAVIPTAEAGDSGPPFSPTPTHTLY